ncbi:single-stranded DNA-binding protein [Janthinobacterium sp. GB4P2]|uniref:single-stranded DNA-binding protein n=1 Tax=Janthinobacterium sp. GB4P2 TaxID=3424189 RepID=UPI003F20D4D5
MAKLFGLARIGRDAELRYTTGQDAVCSISLAFTWGKKGADGKRSTQWVDGALWGKRAEALAPYLLKGTLIAVTLDEVHIETYQGKNGESTKLSGKVLDIELAGSPSAAPAPTQQPAPRPAARQAAAPAQNFADMDDDIPF